VLRGRYGRGRIIRRGTESQPTSKWFGTLEELDLADEGRAVKDEMRRPGRPDPPDLPKTEPTGPPTKTKTMKPRDTIRTSTKADGFRGDRDSVLSVTRRRRA